MLSGLKTLIKKCGKDNKGASLAVVAIIFIIVLACAVVLRIVAGTMMASADKAKSDDRAEILATSLSSEIDKKIKKGTVTLDKCLDESDGWLIGNETRSEYVEGMGNAFVSARVEKDPSVEEYIVTVTASAGGSDSSFIMTRRYSGNDSSGYREIK